MTDEQLIKRIRDAALLEGDFTLRSGRKSRYYLDKYLFETQADILDALADRFARHVDDAVDRLAGAELGGIPLVTATSLKCGRPSILVRNRKKDYGTAKQIEGVLNRGDRVMIVEDVATSGGQVLEAAQTLHDAGATITRIVAVIDRQEGAREHIEGAGQEFRALLTRDDLGIGEPPTTGP